jgi:uncharacterized membrane protein YjjP (DUF1212 family)
LEAGPLEASLTLNDLRRAGSLQWLYWTFRNWIIAFAVFFVALSVLLLSYLYGQLIVSAVFAGALGGIAHELAQSGLTIAFPHAKDDGFYLGSLASFSLGP